MYLLVVRHKAITSANTLRKFCGVRLKGTLDRDNVQLVQDN